MGANVVGLHFDCIANEAMKPEADILFVAGHDRERVRKNTTMTMVRHYQYQRDLADTVEHCLLAN